MHFLGASIALLAVMPSAWQALADDGKPKPDNKWGCSDATANGASQTNMRFINSSPFDVQIFKVDTNCTENSVTSISANNFIYQQVYPNEVWLARRTGQDELIVAGKKFSDSGDSWTIQVESAAVTTSDSGTSNTRVAPTASSTASADSTSSFPVMYAAIGGVALVAVIVAVVGSVVYMRRRNSRQATNPALGLYNPQDTKLSTLNRPGAGAGITTPGPSAQWNPKNGPAPQFRNGVDAYGDFPTQNIHGTSHGRNQLAAAMAAQSNNPYGTQKKKGINFAADTQFESSNGGNGGKFGTLGTFGRKKGGAAEEVELGNPYGAMNNGAAPNMVVTPPTLKKQKQMNTSKAARRASLAWWSAPGVQQQRMQQMQQQQQERQPELPFDGEGGYNETTGRVGVKNNGGQGGEQQGANFFQTVSRTLGVSGAGAGSANNFDYYDQTLHHSQANPAPPQQDPSTIPAPNAMGPGSRLRVIHAHRAELEDELTMYSGDTVVLLESYGDGWCLARVVRSKTHDPENAHIPTDASRVGDDGMIPVACLDIMQTARLSTAPGALDKKLDRISRGRSLYRPESMALFQAAGRDISAYQEGGAAWR
ncbi:hypothetical protein HDU97_000680 [Phlyctochytrium planicorne]|nr:hypothetical protein HDU97_000680 [Phlyctochytrium planicorne]